jgi:hypothetical protein
MHTEARDRAAGTQTDQEFREMCMQRHYTLLALLTAFIVVTVGFGCYANFRSYGLPVAVNMTDAHIAVIAPIAGIPLPAGIQAGDKIDLTALPEASRIAVGIIAGSPFLGGVLPSGHNYDLVIERGDAEVTVPVTAIDLSDATGLLSTQCINCLYLVLTAGLSLLIIWRGRDRAAAGMAGWTIALVVFSSIIFPLDGLTGLAMAVANNFGFLLARVGFYIMADAIARPILGRRARMLFLGVFILILVAGAALVAGAPLLYVMTGWAGGLLPQIGVLWTASYLVPVMLLFSSYRHAKAAQRLRLRWMLWSSIVWVASIFFSNTPILGLQLSLLVNDITSLVAVMGFLYAVLRHRVVDVSVVLDRTLVYGSMTALVVGVLAAVNSLVQHAALGTSASLLLQVAVPLSLGIVLNRVRAYLDRNVERVFFRSKYLAEQALRNFARRCGHIEDVQNLLSSAVAEIRKHTRSPAVAMYEFTGKGYSCLQQAGSVAYPEQIRMDDPAMVAVRADLKEVELTYLDSSLGKESCVFPIIVLGRLRGVLVCTNRPGERFATDEKTLLAEVVRDVGAAWRILRARDNEEYVWEMAQGALNLESARERAKALAAAWSGAVAV